MNMLLSVMLALLLCCLIIKMLCLPLEEKGMFGSIPTRINNFAMYVGIICMIGVGGILFFK